MSKRVDATQVVDVLPIEEKSFFLLPLPVGSSNPTIIIIIARCRLNHWVQYVSWEMKKGGKFFFFSFPYQSAFHLRAVNRIDDEEGARGYDHTQHAPVHLVSCCFPSSSSFFFRQIVARESELSLLWVCVKVVCMLAYTHTHTEYTLLLLRHCFLPRSQQLQQLCATLFSC